MTTTEMLMATADKAEWLAGRRLALDGMVREVRRSRDLAQYMLDTPEHQMVTLRAMDASSCDCGQPACRHLVAATLAAEQSGALDDLLRTRKEQASTALLDAMDSVLPEGPSVKLEVSLTVQGQDVRAGLRVGEDRLYVVKHLPQFFRALREGERIDFGKSFSLHPSWMRFSDEQAALLDVLGEYCRTLESAGQVFTPQEARRLRLLPETASRLLEALRDMPFRLTTRGRTVMQQTIAQQPLPVLFHVSGTPVVLTISCDIPSAWEMITPDGQYVLMDGRIVRIPAENRALTRTLMRCRTGDTAAFVFRREDTRRVMGELLPALMRSHAVLIDEKLARRMVRLPLEARVYLDRAGHDIVARAVFAYGEHEIDPFVLKEETPALLLRDALGERRVMEALAQAGFRVRRGYIYMSGEEEIFRFITGGVEELSVRAQVFMSQDFKRIQARTPRLTGALTGARGRIALELYDDGTPVEELLPLMEAIRARKRYFRYKDGTFLYLDGLEAWYEMAEAVQEAAKGAPSLKQVDAFRAGYLNALIDKAGLPVTVDRQAAQAASPYLDGIKSPVKGLHDYQLTGFRWLCALHVMGMGGILADEMGLGKTVQTIAVILYAVQTEKERMPSIVVMPTSLIFNWLREFERFAPGLRVSAVSGTRAEREKQIAAFRGEDAPDVMLTSYPLLRQDIDDLEAISFRFAVLDEAQNIKNMGSIGAHAAKRLRARTRLALTGTPMENNIGELWSLFDFVLPGYLPPVNEFLKRYDEGRDAEDLLMRIRPFMMRRLKKDVMAELPDKIENTVSVAMTADQRKVYQASLLQQRLRAEDLLKRRGLGGSRAEVLAMMTELRQICCHPALVLPNYAGESGKLEYLMDILPAAIADGHRMLVFSQFTSMLQLIQERLNREGIDTLYLDGATPASERLALAERFNAGGQEAVFLISLKAGGTGLNLTGADIVIHYDPWWNPAAEDQAADRAHRMGQRRVVQVLRLVMHRSIEEQVVAMGKGKRRLFEKLITPGETMPDRLTDRDILALFGENAENAEN